MTNHTACAPMGFIVGYYSIAILVSPFHSNSTLCRRERRTEELNTIASYMTTTTTTTVMETPQKRSFFFPIRPYKDDLPISQPPSNGGNSCLRRRLSSISVRLPSPTASWPFRRSKSASNVTDKDRSSLWSWWGIGFSWVLSLKPSFAGGLDMDDEEAAVLGSHSRGTWRHLLYKLRRLVGSPVHENSYAYDSISYPKNFDDAKRGDAAGHPF